MSYEKTYTNKKFLRKKIKELKQKLTLENNIIYSNIIFKKIEALHQFKEANVILAYWSLPDEVGTHDFVIKWSQQKKIALPIIVGDNLELRLFSNIGELEKSSSLGILEPQTGALVEPSDIDFAIIPGVAFDKKGNRLGRGKGYYDRILNQLNGTKVGVVFDFQVLEEVPFTSYDLPVDIVVTEIN